MTVSQHSFSLFILFLLNLISIQVQLIIMSLKSICIIIYNGCFDHVCSWNYNAYITILCKLRFQHQLHLYIISACHQFIHSVHCFFVYCSADRQKLGEFGETLPREILSDVGELYFNTNGLFCVLHDSPITLAELLYFIDPTQQWVFSATLRLWTDLKAGN